MSPRHLKLWEAVKDASGVCSIVGSDLDLGLHMVIEFIVNYMCIIWQQMEGKQFLGTANLYIWWKSPAG